MADRKKTDWQLLCLAWKTAAGWRGLCHGVAAWVTGVVWIATSPFWITQAWWDQVIATTPTVLGFTLTGFAVFLGFGSDEFKRFLAKGKDPDSTAYMSVGAAFLIFVLVQLLSLFFALAVKSFQFPTPSFLLPFSGVITYGNYITGGVGYFLFLYGMTLALRAALRIFRLSRWYNHFLRLPGKDCDCRECLRSALKSIGEADKEN